LIKIVSGNFEALKTEMKQANIAKREEIKALKKEHKGERVVPNHVQEKVNELEFLQKRMYAPSKVLPVKVDGFVINFKAFKSFMKKIEKLEKEAEIINDGVRVTYRTGPGTKGHVDFIDLSKHFIGFEYVPTAIIQEELLKS
jgi:hypothetical protein